MVIKHKIFIYLLVTTFSLYLASAEVSKYDYTPTFIDGANYSINTNYSTDAGHLEGYSVDTLWDYYTGLGNSLWCALTGCTMTGDINMGDNDLKDAGFVGADKISVGYGSAYPISKVYIKNEYPDTIMNAYTLYVSQDNTDDTTTTGGAIYGQETINYSDAYRASISQKYAVGAKTTGYGLYDNPRGMYSNVKTVDDDSSNSTAINYYAYNQIYGNNQTGIGYYVEPNCFSDGGTLYGFYPDITYDSPHYDNFYGFYVPKNEMTVENDSYAFYSVDLPSYFGGNVTAPNLCYANGTNCVSSGNPFDQSLNTTDNVNFDDLNVDGAITVPNAGQSISVSTVNKFGADTSNPSLNPKTNSIDNIWASMITDDTAGVRRAGMFVAEFNGTSASTATVQGLNAFATTSSSSSGDLTNTGNGGGLRNRYVVRHDGTGTVALASTVSAGFQSNYGNTTEGSSFYAEGPVVGSGVTIDNFTSFKVNDASITGTITNRYGLKVDTLESGTNKWGIYVDTDESYFGGDVNMSGNDVVGVSRIMNDYPIGGGYIDVSSDPIVISGADVRVDGNTDIEGSLYVDYDLNVSGTTNLTGTTWMTTSNTFVRDIFNETHHLNTDLENLDRLYSNVFLTPLNINTFSNATGDYINISAIAGETSITVNLGETNNAQNYRFSYTNIILPLTAGTNSTPVLNRVYVYLNSGVPTWTVSTTEPTVNHAMVARVLLGDTGTEPYSASLQEDGQRGFLKRVQRTNRLQGLIYLSGLDYNATETYLEVGTGTFINGIYDSEIGSAINSTDGFYLVEPDGTYVWYDSFDDITEYSDGETIGTNKYFNVVFGVTPYDGHGHLYAVIQRKPATEYTSVSLAYSDSDNTLNIYPSDDYLKVSFLPVARMVFNEGNHANLLPNGQYAIDYRGGVAGGASSGGGLIEQDPVWTIDKPYYYRNDENINATGYNITSDYFIGNGSQLTGINSGNSSFNQTLTDAKYVPYVGATKDISMNTKKLNFTGNFYNGYIEEYGEDTYKIGYNAGGTDTALQLYYNDIYWGYNEGNNANGDFYLGYPGAGYWGNIFQVFDVGKVWKATTKDGASKIELNPQATARYSSVRIDLNGENVLYGGIDAEGEAYISTGAYHRFNNDYISFGNGNIDEKYFKLYHDTYSATGFPDGTNHMMFDGYKVGADYITPIDFRTNQIDIGKNDSDITNLTINLIANNNTNTLFYDGDTLNYDGDINITGNITIHGSSGFTGNCVNASYVSGIAVGCND